jgi:hypothetical protein
LPFALLADPASRRISRVHPHGKERSNLADIDNNDRPPAAQRALAEAEERRKNAKALDLAPELGGRNGPEPVRYGDWEKKGIAIDF